MTFRRRLATLLVAFVASTVGAAPPPAAGPASPSPPALRLASSATTTPLARTLASHLSERGQAIRLIHSGSETGLEEVRSGRVDAALISRPLSAEEAREFTASTLAMDSLLLIVHERNPLHFASADLIRKIFTREFSDWQQVGAGNAGSIVPVTRRQVDGTRTVFDNAFGIGRVIPSGIVELASNLAAVLYVGADPQAIGYVSAEAYDDARRRGLRIRALSLDNQAPAASGCRQSSYPLCRPIVFVRRTGKPPKAHEPFEKFLGTPEFRAMLTQHGFSAEERP